MPPMTVQGTVPFSLSDDTHGSVAEASTFAELWRYDTDNAMWQALHPSEMITAESVRWPSARWGAAVWRDRGTPAAARNATGFDGDALGNQVDIWMFGGWGSLEELRWTTADRESTELWHFMYVPGEYAHRSSSSSKLLDVGHWTLASAQEGTPDGIEPVYTCKKIEGAACPSGRRSSASWPSPNGAAGGWIFGGISQTCVPDCASGTKTWNDLWHWNGNLQHPAWTEHVQNHPGAALSPSRPADNWPPAWLAPLGWASDAGGGELWLVGDSGEVQDQGTNAYQQAWVGSNLVWRFSLSTLAWDRYQVTKAAGAGLWPAPRESASITSGGWMFGGTPAVGYFSRSGGPKRNAPPGSVECVGEDSTSGNPPTVPQLSGLWRWQDDAGTVFYQ
jgi:hypothetical protein